MLGVGKLGPHIFELGFRIVHQFLKTTEHIVHMLDVAEDVCAQGYSMAYRHL